MYNKIVAGIDIGGSHITAALVDVEKRKVLAHTYKRFDVDSKASAESIISAWCAAIEASINTYEGSVQNLGIAMPGPFDYTEGISLMRNQNKYDALYGMNVKKMLADHLSLSVENIITTNDAACFLQGELFAGVAQNYENVFGITLGTGLGAARTVNGSAEDADLWCSPFKEGVAEDYLSSHWFVKRFFELSGKEIKGVKSLVELVQKEPAASLVFEEFGQNLASFLLPYIHAEKTEMVVLGGNITHAYPLFSSALTRGLSDKAAGVQIKQTVLGENAALVGAASYCLVRAVVGVK